MPVLHHIVVWSWYNSISQVNKNYRGICYAFPIESFLSHIPDIMIVTIGHNFVICGFQVSWSKARLLALVYRIVLKLVFIVCYYIMGPTSFLQEWHMWYSKYFLSLISALQDVLF